METKEMEEKTKILAKFSSYYRHETRTRLRAGTRFGVQALPHYPSDNKGFTLIEIIILIILAGILLPAIIIPFVTGVKGSGKPEMATRAMYLAHERMEYLMKYHYLNVALTPTDFVAFPTGDANYPGENQIYYVDNNFNVVGDGIAATNHMGYKRIIVRVRDPMNDMYEIYSVVTFFP